MPHIVDSPFVAIFRMHVSELDTHTHTHTSMCPCRSVGKAGGHKSNIKFRASQSTQRNRGKNPVNVLFFFSYTHRTWCAVSGTRMTIFLLNHSWSSFVRTIFGLWPHKITFDISILDEHDTSICLLFVYYRVSTIANDFFLLLLESDFYRIGCVFGIAIKREEKEEKRKIDSHTMASRFGNNKS